MRGQNVQRVTTLGITVSAFNKSGGEYWADSAHGGTNAGTEANPFTTMAAMNTAHHTPPSCACSIPTEYARCPMWYPDRTRTDRDQGPLCTILPRSLDPGPE